MFCKKYRTLRLWLVTGLQKVDKMSEKQCHDDIEYDRLTVLDKSPVQIVDEHNWLFYLTIIVLVAVIGASAHDLQLLVVRCFNVMGNKPWPLHYKNFNCLNFLCIKK